MNKNNIKHNGSIKSTRSLKLKSTDQSTHYKRYVTLPSSLGETSQISQGIFGSFFFLRFLTLLLDIKNPLSLYLIAQLQGNQHIEEENQIQRKSAKNTSMIDSIKKGKVRFSLLTFVKSRFIYEKRSAFIDLQLLKTLYACFISKIILIENQQ